MTVSRDRKEELRIDGHEIKDKLRELGHSTEDDDCRTSISRERLTSAARETMRAGNERRLVVRNAAGDTLVDVPLTLGVLLTIARPRHLAAAAVVALAFDCAITIEQREES